MAWFIINKASFCQYVVLVASHVWFLNEKIPKVCGPDSECIPPNTQVIAEHVGENSIFIA